MMLEHETKELMEFTEQAYLDYAMYVILDRALPHVADGLKPVQRRIIYAMAELKLNHQAKYKKSARTVGDVLGKFHPHGDSACYEAMVLMAQEFSYRYPLIDGQGNWGSADDPKSFAAMRYTESRLSKYADLLLQELDKGTVNWLQNFDGTLQEPEILPAKVPNLLLNGTTGIAVGMATDIPPHNLVEIVNACVLLLDKPEANLREIMQHIKGPDFPTNAEIITPKAELEQIYATGSGSLRLRATYKCEGANIIINALPHLVSGAKILEQIAAKMQQKKLPQLVDLRDESDNENPTRLVLVMRSNKVAADELMLYLFAHTDLERSYRVNLNVIDLDGCPRVLDLKSLLSQWLKFRCAKVTLRLQNRLDKLLDRLHLLEGYLIAFLSIDEVIHIVRHSDNPKQELISKFKLTDRQAEAILELKLRQLAKLEEMQIKTEQQELQQEKLNLEKILKSNKLLQDVVKTELNEVAVQHGDKRKSALVERQEAKAIPVIENSPNEPMTVIMSDKGWVRAGKGHDINMQTLTYKSGDGYKNHICMYSHDSVLFMDTQGRSYSLAVTSFPSMRGYGEPVTKHLSPQPGATISIMFAANNLEQLVILLSSHGYGFATKLDNLVCKSKKGKAIFQLTDQASLLTPLVLPPNYSNNDAIALLSSDNRLLLLKLADISLLNKGRGKKLMGLSKELLAKQIHVMQIFYIPKGKGLLFVKNKQNNVVLSWKELQEYVGSYGQRGKVLPKPLQNKAIDVTE